MTSDYAIVSIKVRLEVENDEFNIVCNFGGRRMSVKSYGGVEPHPVAGRKKSPV